MARWLFATLAACSFNDKELTDAGGPNPDGEPPVVCDDNLEPNDTLQTATVADPTNGPVMFTNLAVCPGSDEDFFFIPLEVGNQAIDIVTVRDGQGFELVLATQAGTALEVGVDSGSETRACIVNLPMGVYYAIVSEAVSTKYRITISLRPNCN